MLFRSEDRGRGGDSSDARRKNAREAEEEGGVGPRGARGGGGVAVGGRGRPGDGVGGGAGVLVEWGFEMCR